MKKRRRRRRPALAGVGLGLGGLRLLLADPEELKETSPVELGGHGDRGETARDDLQDHAPAAGIQIGEDGGHGQQAPTGSGSWQASRGVASRWTYRSYLVTTRAPKFLSPLALV